MTSTPRGTTHWPQSTSSERWPGTAWAAAAQEARAHIARAEGNPGESERLLSAAAAGFRAAGQPSDAARCARAIDELQTVGAKS